MSALICSFMWQWEVIGTQGSWQPHSAYWNERTMLWIWRTMVSAPPQVFRRVQRSPFFPDISVSSLPKTLQTPLHTFLLRKRGFPPPRSRRSCWCPPGLCTLVWTGPPPASTGGIHQLFSWNICTSTQPFNAITLDWGRRGDHVCETINESIKEQKNRESSTIPTDEITDGISTEVLAI